LPYELFKQQSIPLNFFHPIGNPVVVLSSQKKKSKLDPRGELRILVGFNPELKSYRILTEENVLVNSKSVTFLEFTPSRNTSTDYGDILVEDRVEKPVETTTAVNQEEQMHVKEEEEVDELSDREDEPDDFRSLKDSTEDDDDVATSLVPKNDVPSGRLLRDRTLQVKPVKYTHFTEDPKTFKKAVSGANAKGWTQAINDELTT
jgi:hypothetical protein